MSDYDSRPSPWFFLLVFFVALAIAVPVGFRLEHKAAQRDARQSHVYKGCR